MEHARIWPIGQAIQRPEWGAYLSPQWLAKRRDGTYIGCSTVAEILNLSPWRGPWSAWQKLTGQGDDVEQTESMQLGLDMEPVILRWWRRKRPEIVSHWRPRLTYSHPTIPVLGASIDAVGDSTDGDQVPAECKHLHWRAQEDVDAFVERGMLEGGLVPIFVQVQAQLACTQLPFAHLSIICEKQPTVITVPRDDAMVARIEAEIPAFFDRFVATGVEPPAGPADVPSLRSFYPTSEPGRVVEAPDLAELVEQGRELKAKLAAKRAEARAIEKDLAPCKATLMQRMQDADELVVGGSAKPVTWKTNKAGKRSLKL